MEAAAPGDALADKSKSTIRPLISFFLIAFLIAWGSWIPALHWRSVPKTLPLIGLFGPMIAAMIVRGRNGVAEVLARLRIWRIPVRSYAMAGLLMPVVFLVAVLLDHLLFGADLHRMWLGSAPAFLLASLVWLLFVTSGEEIGWRGFALPEMLRRGLSPFAASLVLGIVWGIWHLPFYWSGGETGIPYAFFLALTVGQSLVYTALFLRSRGSVLPAILLHATTDLGARLYHMELFGSSTWTLIDVMVLIAGAALLFSARENRFDGAIPSPAAAPKLLEPAVDPAAPRTSLQ